MGQTYTTQVNEVTPEENISLEQQAAMQEEAANQRNQTLEAKPEEGKQEVVEQVEETTPERPEWLDEKFDSPEDMAKAYKALQKKMSTPKTEKKAEDKEEAAVDENVLGASIESATNEFSETGELSDETFEALEKAGLPRSFVQQYIDGQTAVSVAQANEIKDSVGGEGNYAAMSEWAGENLSDADLDAFNGLVEGGSVEQARVAVKGLYAQFVAAGGAGPALVQGGTSAAADVQPFSSTAQVTEAMSDPRYANDPAFREQVEKRLAVSSVF